MTRHPWLVISTKRDDGQISVQYLEWEGLPPDAWKTKPIRFSLHWEPDGSTHE